MRGIKNIVAYLLATVILGVGWHFLKPKPEKAEERVDALEGIQDKVNKYGDKLNSTAEALDDVNVGTSAAASEVLGGETSADSPGPGAQNPLAVAKSLQASQAAMDAAQEPVEAPPVPPKPLRKAAVEQAPVPPPVVRDNPDAGVSDAEEYPRGPTLDVNTSLSGSVAPYKVVAAPGWYVYEGGADLHLGIGEGLTVAINASPGESDNQGFARAAVAALVGEDRGLQLKRQEVVNLDRRSWGRFDFGTTEGDRQAILFTHAGPFGGYGITVRGTDEEVSEYQQSIVRLIGSFRFPPDNYGAKARSGGVRVVVPE